jgi:hypothetical protein
VIAPDVSTSAEHFMWFVDHALDQMAVILRDLGDNLANQRPRLEGANSPYVIMTHCLGVVEFWGGHAVAERVVQRDRAGEFVATGSVADLLARAALVRRQLDADLEGVDSMAPPFGVKGEARPYNETKGSVLVHILQELFQHLGQMELTRDLLVSQ